jgi:high-affinity Fe2+/Pb2+ permease
VGDLSNGVLVLTVLPGATPWLPLVLITGTAAIALLLVGLAVVRRVRRTLTGLTDRPSGR